MESDDEKLQQIWKVSSHLWIVSFEENFFSSSVIL